MLRETSDPWLDWLADELSRGLAADRGAEARTRALVRLALELSSWQRLAREGLSDAEAADLVVDAAGACG